jgi:hypothetical protein
MLLIGVSILINLINLINLFSLNCIVAWPTIEILNIVLLAVF